MSYFARGSRRKQKDETGWRKRGERAILIAELGAAADAVAFINLLTLILFFLKRIYLESVPDSLLNSILVTHFMTGRPQNIFSDFYTDTCSIHYQVLVWHKAISRVDLYLKLIYMYVNHIFDEVLGLVFLANSQVAFRLPSPGFLIKVKPSNDSWKSLFLHSLFHRWISIDQWERNRFIRTIGCPWASSMIDNADDFNRRSMRSLSCRGAG